MGWARGMDAVPDSTRFVALGVRLQSLQSLQSSQGQGTFQQPPIFKELMNCWCWVYPVYPKFLTKTLEPQGIFGTALILPSSSLKHLRIVSKFIPSTQPTAAPCSTIAGEPMEAIHFVLFARWAISSLYTWSCSCQKHGCHPDWFRAWLACTKGFWNSKS